MTNFSHGRAAEEAASNYLEKLGYKVLTKNWKTRYCEIDIVAKNKKTVYFVEVKYRVSDSQGTGLEYITAKKLGQMKFAAQMWVAENHWADDYQLAAMEVSGPDYKVSNFIANV